MSSIPPSGIVSAAGSPQALRQGNDIQRGASDQAQQVRQHQSEQKAEDAAGVGQTEQDEQAGDRDADGRRLWEATERAAESDAESHPGKGASHDPSGNCGTRLDLSG